LKFHSVEILETVVRQSGVLAHRKKCLFCKALCNAYIHGSLHWPSLTRTVCGVIFNVRIGKDFGLKNSVFYIRTVLTENNRFLCIFSFTVFIVNEYFTTVTKLRIGAHHLLLTIILSILKCVTLYQVTIIPSYLYSQMRKFKIFNTSHFVT
jgi:hypothetical protein